MGQQWQLGDECFIVVKNLNIEKPYLQVMPAVITHIGGTDGKTLTAMANTHFIVGDMMAESNQPFRTFTEASDYISNFVKKIVGCLGKPQVVGSRPVLNFNPEEIPRNGDLIYVVDEVACEIIEARVGIVRWHNGTVEVGYDPNPSDPEASILRAKRWFRDSQAALSSVKAKYGDKQFGFVSEHELARNAAEALA